MGNVMQEQGRPSDGRRALDAAADPKAARPARVGLFHMVSLAAAASSPALADVTITDDRTTPVATSTVNNGAADNIIVDAQGSVIVQSGAAVTIDSSNDVSNAGELGSEDDNDTTGVLILGGVTSDFTNSGNIELNETFNASDSDNDGDLDGQFAQGANRVGVWLNGPGVVTGDLTFTSASRVTIEGNNSAGLRFDAGLNGDLNLAGSVVVLGDNTFGVDVNAPISGDVLQQGTVSAQGANATAVDIGADIGGALRIRGAIQSTGFRSTTRPTNPTVLDNLDADDLLIGGAALAVRASVGGGVLIDGVGVEDDEDDDGDGVPENGPDTTVTTDDDTDDDSSGSVQSLGSAPAVLITTNGADTTLGAVVDSRGAFAGLSYGFVNRTTVSGNGVYDDVEAYGVRIAGAGGNTVSVTGGVLNDGAVLASAVSADAAALSIGADAVAPTILNRGRIASQVSSSEADTAYGARIEAGANVSAFDNRGGVTATIVGDNGDAVAFIDESGGVDAITNSGSINALAQAVEGDFVGRTVAIDVSANTTGVTLLQIPTIPFSDDDATDVGSTFDVEIVGDVLFGSGADSFTVQTGLVAGAIAFGAGADSLFIDGGATVSGALSDSDGALTIAVADGELDVTGGALNLTSASFGAESILRIAVSSNPANTALMNASGVISFADGALVAPILVDGLPDDGAVIFLQAGSLVGGNFVSRTLAGEGIPFVYNIEIGVALSDPNALEARYALKTAQELGLDVNETAAFASVIDALRRDTEVSIAFSNVDTQEEFSEAYNQLLPNFAAGSAELAVTAIAQGQGATANRLSTARMSGFNFDSAWVQEIGYVVERDAPNFGVDYEGQGFGFAAGVDGPLSPGVLLGLSVAFSASEVEEAGRAGTISTSLGQLNAYLGGGLGPFEWDLIGGVGVAQMTSDRQIAFSGFAATAEADWLTYEGHGLAQIGLPLHLGDRFTITPRANIVYIGLREDAYEETGGGAAIDLAVDEATTSRSWADAALDFAWRFGDARQGGTEFTPKISVGYRTNVMDDPAERTVTFVSGGTPFTLIDEEIGDGGMVAGFTLSGGGENSQVSLMYEGEFGDQIDRHSLNASVRFRF
ncbi:MAG: autotransporter domain-containing protein [Alphaproteobacteria bacterium]|nr:autotransporter domain-containing protein [Alphaproteobacteria bacterium]